MALSVPAFQDGKAGAAGKASPDYLVPAARRARKALPALRRARAAFLADAGCVASKAFQVRPVLRDFRARKALPALPRARAVFRGTARSRFQNRESYLPIMPPLWCGAVEHSLQEVLTFQLTCAAQASHLELLAVYLW